MRGHYSIIINTMAANNSLSQPSEQWQRREALRLRDLHLTGLLDTAAEERFDRLTALASELLGVPIALVSLVDENRQWFKSVRGLSVSETERSVSFCSRALEEPDNMLIVEDAMLDPRFAKNPLVTGAPRIRFYAGFVLRSWYKRPLGTLCVIDEKARSLTDQQKATLRMLADIAQDEVRRGRQLRTLAKKTEALAYRDNATGLPNLSALHRETDTALETAGETSVALIRTAILNLNSAVVSTDEEHDATATLTRCAHLLYGILPDHSFVARGSDEELVTLIPGQTSEDDLDEYLTRIHATIERAWHPAGHAHHLVARSGASLGRQPTSSYSRLMGQAGLALRDTLGSSADSKFRICSDDTRRRLDRRSTLHKRLRHAIEHGIVEAHAQPILDVKTGRLCGAEMLSRWNDADLGAIAPSEFVPLAEEWGLALPLTELVMHQAFELRQQLRQSQIHHCRLAINVPGFLLRDTKLIEGIVARLHQGSLYGSQLALEITEHSYVHADSMLLRNISKLREAGLKFSVDDFGTGYASFGQLKTMPVDAVKLDRVFVQGISTDARDASIARGLLRMITDLGLTVIAEGVETTDQYDFLSRHGCQMAQGWLFDRALPTKEFLSRARTRDAWLPPIKTTTSTDSLKKIGFGNDCGSVQPRL